VGSVEAWDFTVQSGELLKSLKLGLPPVAGKYVVSARHDHWSRV
jgi:hypothetical protein